MQRELKSLSDKSSSSNPVFSTDMAGKDKLLGRELRESRESIFTAVIRPSTTWRGLNEEEGGPVYINEDSEGFFQVEDADAT